MIILGMQWSNVIVRGWDDFNYLLHLIPLLIPLSIAGGKILEVSSQALKVDPVNTNLKPIAQIPPDIAQIPLDIAHIPPDIAQILPGTAQLHLNSTHGTILFLGLREPRIRH
jgi:hypothetical protein